MKFQNTPYMEKPAFFGESVKLQLIKSQETEQEEWNCFDSGNAAIDTFFRSESRDSVKEITHVFRDLERNRIIAAASLACSSIPIMSSDKYDDSVPAVEITYFAVDKDYQKVQQTGDKADGYFSDSILSMVIDFIYSFTDELCGAVCVLLYSTENAVHFYERNGFERIDVDYYLTKQNRFLEGCVPMFYML